MKIPRGIRNKNPGNIRKGAKWLGLAAEQPDKEFCTFTEAIYGIRALMKLLQNYSRMYHLDTVREIISRWAPPNENNTVAYIQMVAKHLKVNPDSPLDLTEKHTLVKLAQAITRHENGQPPEEFHDNWFTDDWYNKAADLLLKPKGKT